jgi:hypothetical protein
VTEAKTLEKNFKNQEVVNRKKKIVRQFLWILRFIYAEIKVSEKKCVRRKIRGKKSIKIPHYFFFLQLHLLF